MVKRPFTCPYHDNVHWKKRKTVSAAATYGWTEWKKRQNREEQTPPHSAGQEGEDSAPVAWSAPGRPARSLGSTPGKMPLLAASGLTCFWPWEHWPLSPILQRPASASERASLVSCPLQNQSCSPVVHSPRLHLRWTVWNSFSEVRTDLAAPFLLVQV